MNQNNKIDFSKLKIGNYCRKSQRDDGRQVLSIPSQIEEAVEVAKYHNLSSFVEIFKEARSAKEEHLRQEFTRMKKMIDEGKIDSIVCWKLDRLARNMSEGGWIIDYLSSGKLKAVFTADKVWLPTDNVILMAVEFSQGTQYIKDLSGNVKRGQRAKAKTGTPTGMASLGFLNSKQGEKGERWWYVDEDRFWKVQKLFELFLTREYSVRKLYRYAIDELGLTTPMKKKLGGKPVTVTNIYKLLKNPVYAGFFMVQGQKYLLTKDLPAVITEEQHEIILQMIESKNKPKSQKHKAVYSGFIFSDTNDFIGQDIKYQIICDCKKKFAYRNKTHCPKCGKTISSFMNSKYFIQSYYYNNRKKKAGLDYNSITESTINEELTNYVNENLIMPTELLEWSKSYIHELKDKEVSDGLHIIQDREKRKIDFEKKKSSLRAMWRDEKITEEEYNQDLKMLIAEYKDLQQEIKTVDWLKEMNDIVDITACVREVLESGSFEAKRNILTRLGSNLTWNDETLLINSKKSINTLISGLNPVRSIIKEFGNEKALVQQGLSDDNSELCISLRRR